jgi:hypothetical protein
MVLEQENIHVGFPNLLIELLVCFRFTVHTSVTIESLHKHPEFAETAASYIWTEWQQDFQELTKYKTRAALLLLFQKEALERLLRLQKQYQVVFTNIEARHIMQPELFIRLNHPHITFCYFPEYTFLTLLSTMPILKLKNIARL